jgi:hypothetical protein
MRRAVSQRLSPWRSSSQRLVEARQIPNPSPDRSSTAE